MEAVYSAVDRQITICWFAGENQFINLTSQEILDILFEPGEMTMEFWSLGNSVIEDTHKPENAGVDARFVLAVSNGSPDLLQRTKCSDELIN